MHGTICVHTHEDISIDIDLNLALYVLSYRGF